MPRPKCLTVLIAMLTLLVVACHKEKPETSTTGPSHRVARSPVGTTQTILEKTFALKGTATFPFEIPAHAVLPHLRGTFESFLGRANGESGEESDIDFLVLNEDQEGSFAGKGASEALLTVEATHSQEVNFDLPASRDQPVKYYLVFRNPAGSKSRKVVEANFRVDF